MITINASIRKNVRNKSFNRKLRLMNKIPAILYGKKINPISIEIDSKIISLLQDKKEFYDTILILKINKKIFKVKTKAIQKHPVKTNIIHIDLLCI